jgi:hypothetical protein
VAAPIEQNKTFHLSALQKQGLVPQSDSSLIHSLKIEIIACWSALNRLTQIAMRRRGRRLGISWLFSCERWRLGQVALQKEKARTQRTLFRGTAKRLSQKYAKPRQMARARWICWRAWKLAVSSQLRSQSYANFNFFWFGYNYIRYSERVGFTTNLDVIKDFPGGHFFMEMFPLQQICPICGRHETWTSQSRDL